MMGFLQQPGQTLFGMFCCTCNVTHAVPLLGDAHYRQVPVCGARRTVPKVWMGRDRRPGFENVRDRWTVDSIIEQAVCSLTSARTCFRDSRRPDGCAVRSEGLPARQGERGNVVSRCTHRKPQRQGRKKKDTDRVVVELSLVGSISCIDRTSKIEPPRSFQFTKPHPRGRPCTTTPDISTTISQFQRLLGYISEDLADTIQQIPNRLQIWRVRHGSSKV
jgi:hypothetical protein